MIVCGIDPSLTGTGIAIVDTADFADREVLTIRSKGREDANLGERQARLSGLVRKIADAVMLLNRDSDRMADLVVIEAPAYDSRTGHQHDRSGLWWFLVDRLHVLGVPVVEVTTGGVKKYATGNGGASKDAVLAAVVRRYLDVDVSNNNEADALVLAAMGARHLGHPIEDSLPARHLEAMDSVKWPELVA